MSIYQELIKTLALQSLTKVQAFDLQMQILNQEVKTNELVDIFQALSHRQVEAQEIEGFLEASKQMQINLNTDFETLDVCGTGGDGLNTFNISSLVAIVCSAGGVKTAKHGNRSSSGKCGGADILEVLGININLTAQQALESLDKTNFCFLFAPVYNPAFKYAKEARVEYAKPTYFNLLGPLLNPTNPKFQLLGLSRYSLAPVLAKVLQTNGTQNTWILKSIEGMDELSPCGLSYVTKVNQNSITESVIDAAEFSMSGEFENLIGGDREINLEIAKNVLNNTGKSEQIKAVVLNAGAGFLVSNIVTNLNDGIELAEQIITSGKAQKQLEKIIEFGKQYE